MDEVQDNSIVVSRFYNRSISVAELLMNDFDILVESTFSHVSSIQ